MAKEGEDEYGVARGGKKATPEETAAVYAAMMEELGIARLDTLPLEDNKGTGEHVDLDALDRNKKANDPRTIEFKIAKKNAAAHSAWKNAVFDDVDEADLELDSMNSGQSHRQRMNASLEASRSSRGGYAARGGRDGQSTRGGGGHSMSRNNLGGFNSLDSTKKDPIDAGKMLVRFRGQSVPRGNVNSRIRGNSRRNVAEPIMVDVIAPKPNLSFNDNRSVDVLSFEHDVPDKGNFVPVRRNREPQAVPKVVMPNDYNQRFALASPEDFLAQSWARKSGKNVFTEKEDENLAPHGPLDQTLKPKAMPNTTSANEKRDSSASTTPFARLIDAQQPNFGSLLGIGSKIAYSAEVQVGYEFGGQFLTIGSGTICIKIVNQAPRFGKIIQIEVHGKKLLEEPLLESFVFKLDLCSITFYTRTEGHQIKWTLLASLPATAASLAKALENFRPQPASINLVDAAAVGHTSILPISDEEESLISFSVENPLPVSQFTEDLFSLMGDEFIEDTVVATNVKIGQSSTSVVASENPGGGEVEGIWEPQKMLRGLATSRFANSDDVGKFLNSSTIFQKVPDGNTAFNTEHVSQRSLSEAQKVACDQKLIGTARKQPERIYSVEKLLDIGKQLRSVAKISGLTSRAESFPKDESRPLSKLEGVSSRRLGTSEPEDSIQNSALTVGLDAPITSDHETAWKLPDLTTSGHTSPRMPLLAKGFTNSKEIEPHDAKQTCRRAPMPIQGLSASKYASPNAKALEKEPLDLKKPEPTSEKLGDELLSSRDLPNHAIREFKSFLTAQKKNTSGSTPPNRLSLSSTPGTTLVNPVLNNSTLSHIKPASSELPQRLSALDQCDHGIPKPFQGLASSRYADALNNGPIKKKLSSLVQSGPSNLNCVAKSSIVNTELPDTRDEMMNYTGIVVQADAALPSVFSMKLDSKKRTQHEGKVVDSEISTGIVRNGEPSFQNLGGWGTLRRRDNFSSHASKDSTVTGNPFIPKPQMELSQGNIVFPKNSGGDSAHQSILDVDSSATSEFFPVAIEEATTKGEADDGNNSELEDTVNSSTPKAGHSDLVLFPGEVVRPEVFEEKSLPEPPYSNEMSELMGDSSTSTLQPSPSDMASASLSKLSNLPFTPARKSASKAKGGLLSSRFATAAETIAPRAMKLESQQSLMTVSNEVRKRSSRENLSETPPVYESGSSPHPRVLKPTANKFTPSAGINLTTTANASMAPVANDFSSMVQPVMATIFVQDPHWPGMFKEVSGLLKIGGTPTIGFVTAPSSPMGEIVTSGNVPANLLSPPRAPLSPVYQQSVNIKDKQEEVQERLAKSLSQRRLSESPGSSEFPF